jgi:hypothetical protein
MTGSAGTVVMRATSGKPSTSLCNRAQLRAPPSSALKQNQFARFMAPLPNPERPAKLTPHCALLTAPIIQPPGDTASPAPP